VPLVLLLVSLACNLPGADERASSADLTARALAATETALAERVRESEASLTPVPPEGDGQPPPEAAATECQAMITSNVDVNVRGGPSTVYTIYGYIPTGGTAQVDGRNAAGTWWYVVFPAGPGGHGWVWGDAVTPSCVPPGVQVVAAPPTPIPPPEPATATMTATDTTNGPLVIGTMILAVTLVIPQAQGDIVLQDIFLSTGGEILVRVLVTPTGSLTGSLQYKVWVDNNQIATISQALPAGSQVYWTGHTISGNHSVRVKLDTNGAYFETNEGNNEGTVNCSGGNCH